MQIEINLSFVIYMKRVTLYFSDAASLFDFILTENISGVETRATELSLKGTLSDQQIAVACSTYGAVFYPVTAS